MSRDGSNDLADLGDVLQREPARAESVNPTALAITAGPTHPRLLVFRIALTYWMPTREGRSRSHLVIVAPNRRWRSRPCLNPLAAPPLSLSSSASRPPGAVASYPRPFTMAGSVPPYVRQTFRFLSLTKPAQFLADNP